MARPPSLIFDPRREAIIADLDGGLSQQKAAAKYGVSIQAMSSFAKYRRREAGLSKRAKSEKEAAPTFAKLRVGASPLEEAQASAEFARRMLEWMQRNAASPKDITAQQGMYLTAQRLVAKLAGALDVTPSQIARSPFIRQLCSEFEAVLDGDMVKITDFRRRLERLVYGKEFDAKTGRG